MKERGGLTWVSDVICGGEESVFICGNEVAVGLLEVAAGFHQFHLVEVVVIANHNCSNLHSEHQ